MARRSTLLSVQLAPQQPCAAWGRTPPVPHSRGPPTLQLVSQQEQVEIAAQGALAQRMQSVCQPSFAPSCTSRPEGGPGDVVISKPKSYSGRGPRVHTDTWASGHAADQNWTLARSQEVKSKMEGMGCVLADRVRNQTQPTSGPLLLLGTLALGFMVPGLGGCYPPHLATPRKDGVWHDG